MRGGNLAREMLPQDMEMCNVGIKECIFLSTVPDRERVMIDIEENTASAYITKKYLSLKRDLVWKSL